MPDSAWQIMLPWIGNFSLICLHSVWGSQFILTSGCFDTSIIHFYPFSSDVSMDRQLIMLHVQGDCPCPLCNARGLIYSWIGT
ncbi:hypothetical protein BDV32DRAFT_26912 [Aspergillus pseudonomiae]|nr:hypothetical protein BDV32DRAFT_26912 [Aspergillus pseudonomiae]